MICVGVSEATRKVPLRTTTTRRRANKPKNNPTSTWLNPDPLRHAHHTDTLTAPRGSSTPGSESRRRGNAAADPHVHCFASQQAGDHRSSRIAMLTAAGKDLWAPPGEVRVVLDGIEALQRSFVGLDFVSECIPTNAGRMSTFAKSRHHRHFPIGSETRARAYALAGSS